MNDLISRQAAIDLLKQMRKDGDMIPWEGKDVFARIRKLPSAQPEQRWIPCSERLPDEGCEVLVSAWTGEVGLGTRHEGENAFWRLDTNITVNMANIIAWMPLPKPYKG